MISLTWYTFSMIPKIIHYCWFGGKPLSPLIENCIASWKVTNPDFEIQRWDESNTDLAMHPFVEQMYAERNWAFVADYVRLHVLSTYGGVYLDTDMKLVQSLDQLLDTPLLLGKESDEYISCGMIGATPHHPFIQAIMKEYDTMKKLRPNPVIMTELWKKVAPTPVIVLPAAAFYPFTSGTIKQYHGQDLPPETYGVHLWNYSWGHPLNKFFKKLGIYSLGKRVTELLGIKKLLKTLFGFI